MQNDFTYCDGVKLGNYVVDTQAVIQLGWTYGRSQYKQMFKHSEFQAPEDKEGVWTFDERKQLIRRRRVQNEDSVGDLKVTYETIDGFTAEKGMEVSAIGT